MGEMVWISRHAAPIPDKRTIAPELAIGPLPSSRRPHEATILEQQQTVQLCS